MKSYLLSEKVQLWRRQIVDTVDGDVAEYTYPRCQDQLI